MGSLMAGWNSHIQYIRSDTNKSLTNEEIARFWRLKKIEEEERFYHTTCYKLSKEDKIKVDDVSEPLAPSLVGEEDSMRPLLMKHGWWICSKLAFLNEPPIMSWEPSYNYVAQFHIARKHIGEQ